jgi:(p)ppGpp synthase/HD superfamily hydrolase
MSKQMLAVAIALAAKVFEDKTDKSGKPYILHCLRVMNGVDQNDEEQMQIAVLHDVVEDTDTTISDLVRLGFSERVINAITLLTHNSNTTTYDNYIKAISYNTDATRVKLADLKDNSDITRLKGLRKKDIERTEKYHRAYVFLSN